MGEELVGGAVRTHSPLSHPPKSNQSGARQNATAVLHVQVQHYIALYAITV